jgi:hypothetical protein
MVQILMAEILTMNNTTAVFLLTPPKLAAQLRQTSTAEKHQGLTRSKGSTISRASLDFEH